MANKTYCFVSKKTYDTLKKAGRKTFPVHKILEVEATKEKAIKSFAKDAVLDVKTVKEKYHCFVYTPSNLKKSV